MSSILRRLKLPVGNHRSSTDHHPNFPPLDGTNYRNVLRQIEDYLNPAWYLEIGSRTGHSLMERKCNFVAVDLEFDIKRNVFNRAQQMHFMQQSSDDFFASDFLDRLGITPDLVFIDGMHLFEYALRDFMNAEERDDERRHHMSPRCLPVQL